MRYALYSAAGSARVGEVPMRWIPEAARQEPRPKSEE